MKIRLPSNNEKVISAIWCQSRSTAPAMPLSFLDNTYSSKIHPSFCHQSRTMLTSSQAAATLNNVQQKQAVSKTSWQAQHNIDIQRVTQTAIIHELTQQQTKTIESVVPWFLKNMPQSYFSEVPERYRIDHIKAISALRDATLKMDIDMNLKHHLPDGRLVLTFIVPSAQPGLLLKMVKNLPWNFNSEDYRPLSRAQVFTSADETLSLNMFVYGSEKPTSHSQTIGNHILEYAETVSDITEIVNDIDGVEPLSLDLFSRESLKEYFAKCEPSYIIRSEPRRFLQQRILYNQVSGTECMAVSIDKLNDDDSGKYWIHIALANSLPQVALENASRILFQHKLDVSLSHLDMIADGENGNVCLLSMLVSPVEDAGHEFSEEVLQPIIQELKRTKWLDPRTMDLVFNRHPWLGVTKGEMVTTFCSLLHPIMASRNQYAFSMENIFDSVTGDRYIKYVSAICDLFLERFNPSSPLQNEAFEERYSLLLSQIKDNVDDAGTQELLKKMLEIVRHTLRTNIYLENRYALGLRLDPRLMSSAENSSLPYGVIFVHGRRFNGFHVRFKDIARGGLRLVTPSSPEQHALESGRHYDECYGLAFAQQLKNKDIPEGGSKAVTLINCNDLSNKAKQFVMRKSVKAFTNTILDLVVETKELQSQVVDYLGKKEEIYLGPDEQVTVEDINWIVKRATQRGHNTPNAFMSSKPKGGINHKVYGVTSEGVIIYLDVALRQALNINPHENEFTVKMTGGPDGDVAGNAIKILYREYGDKAKIVGIADSSGCAEDPQGLNPDELLRLVNESLSISNFNRSKFGPNGQLHLVDTEQGVHARNTMHNRLVADAFIPAGGRPNTIDINNYKKYLLPDGSPSSPLIVEGANLFITKDARKALYDTAGVIIVKDSSANKCGVITSSYEISAAMLLDETEFYNYKEIIVEEVLEKLRYFAKMEAELLFREFRQYDGEGTLPYFSQVISETINSTKDAIIEGFDEFSDEEKECLMSLLYDHLPPIIAEKAFDRVPSRVPFQYIKNAIASCLATKLVYHEGTKFVQSIPKHKLVSVSMEYFLKEKEINNLKKALDTADIPSNEKEQILRLLNVGGARASLILGKN